MGFTEPPAPFDADAIESVAAEFDVSPARLTELVVSHQEVVDRSPGVENLVYEWRKQFGATVIDRSQEWYFVAAPTWAWEEFVDVLDATEAEFAALSTLHERTVLSRSDHPTGESGETTPIVLCRQ